MRRVLVLWAPDTADTRRVAEAVRKAFEQANCAATALPALEATIAHIAAAELLVIGAQKAVGVEAHPDFTELLRAFRGVNLAGRAAGLFAIGPEKSSACLRRALNDTEIAMLEDEPCFSDSKVGSSPELGEWARRLIALREENRRDHG
jgi:hypothetical protein